MGGLWHCLNHITWIYLWLVVSIPLKNMKVNGKDYSQYYIMENKSHVWNHQPDGEWQPYQVYIRIYQVYDNHIRIYQIFNDIQNPVDSPSLMPQRPGEAGEAGDTAVSRVAYWEWNMGLLGGSRSHHWWLIWFNTKSQSSMTWVIWGYPLSPKRKAPHGFMEKFNLYRD